MRSVSSGMEIVPSGRGMGDSFGGLNYLQEIEMGKGANFNKRVLTYLAGRELP